MGLLKGWLVLIGFFLAGELARVSLSLPFSGGVLGMMALTLCLLLKGQVSEELASASQALISVLVLLIMPGVVGIFFNASAFDGYWLAILLALAVGTVLSVISTLLLMRWMVEADNASRASDD